MAGKTQCNPNEAIKEHQQQLLEKGFTVIEHVFTEGEITAIIREMEQATFVGPAFRRTNDLFAIRRFLQEVPAVRQLLGRSPQLRSVIDQLLGTDYFVVKSIYFDKPQLSNWFVSYHQDLTISVDKKVATEGFNHWTVKQDQFAVQPPVTILEQIYTIRIHLDDTTGQNGALKVIPGSHTGGVVRPEMTGRLGGNETTCNVGKGGIMIMKPLLLHASDKTTGAQRRRVIHIEFSNVQLPESLQWAEQIRDFIK